IYAVGVRGQTGVTTPSAGAMNAHFINVGQGVSVLLEFSCGAALIDTGGEANGNYRSTPVLTRYLDEFFARRKDLNTTFWLVIISPPVIDHTRGLIPVMTQYKIQAIVDDGLTKGSGGRQQVAMHRLLKDPKDKNFGIAHLDVNQRDTSAAKSPIPPGHPFSN